MDQKGRKAHDKRRKKPSGLPPDFAGKPEVSGPLVNESKSQKEADAVEIVRLVWEGKRVTDPALIRRIGDRASKVRQAILEKHGVVEWAVNLIREARDEG
ncbi:MAG TPA: hypothetical protein VGZ22_23425 [Isosphaeraceae bacterium]|jgi:hypothetical protein|nr:hypothetical protein [Isosphaeraceae bacterium]